ncbi:hypothetical protein Bca4012_072172 [Brassica carinata]
MVTLSDGEGDGDTNPNPKIPTTAQEENGEKTLDGTRASSDKGSPGSKTPSRELLPPSEVVDDAPHVGSIHATVNRLWSLPKMGSKIDVQFLEKNTVLFRIENPQMRTRVINRTYWHIAEVPLVVNEWSPETALNPPDLSAMPIWIDLKGVPSMMFSHKALKCLSRAAGNFVKLHPNTEKCTHLDVARILVEVNMHKPLVEKISFLDKDGVNVMIDVSYPWLPPKCSDKEAVVDAEDSDVVKNGEGKVRYELEATRNVVSDLLLELEGLPPALGSAGYVSRTGLEYGSMSKTGEITSPYQEWALVRGKSPSLVLQERQLETGSVEGSKEEIVGIKSPSRFSVLATEGFEEGETTEVKEDDETEDEIEEGEAPVLN